MNAWKLSLLVTALIALAGGASAQGAAGAMSKTNRLDATFTERPASMTDRTFDLGTLQFITTGTGNVQGFGAATVVVGITQDHSVTPCGPGSWTNAATRRIVLERGVLVLYELSVACITSTGPVISGTYRVD